MKRGFALLLDPDRVTAVKAAETVRLAAMSGFSSAWVGGSFLHNVRRGVVDAAVHAGKAADLPIFAILGLSSPEPILVPGLSGVLLPLIGTLSSAGELVRQAYRATPAMAELGVPVVPLAYLAVDGKRITSSIHGLQGVPLPCDKPEIAATLALCSQLMGIKTVYLDAGSGAMEAIPSPLIAAVRKATTCQLVVGGGVRRPEQAETAFAAGADIVVIGSAFEEDGSHSLFEAFSSVLPGELS